MKSRTSFSKLTPFRKDITRFIPIWALYLIGLMLVLFEETRYYAYDRFARNILRSMTSGFSVVNLIYAAVCAVMFFGDLYNTRMCYSLHTLPQRRESWLLSHLAAGLLYSLVPNTVAALYMMTQLEGYWYLALYWLLAVTMQFVFYYGVAALSALLTGNRFAMLAVYAGINFVALLAWGTVEIIYMPMLTGVSASTESFIRFCPTYYILSEFDFFTFKAVEVQNAYYEYTTFYEYTGLGSGWGYTAILAGLGVVLMGVSVLLYRLRHLECAGDFVAFRKLNAPACLIMTLCVGLLFAVVGEAMGSGYMAWLCVGIVIGYFGSLMLLERRVKVFRPKVFIWFGVLCAVLIASFLMIGNDVFGIVHWTPEADQVKSVTVSNYNSGSNLLYDDYYYGNRMSVTLTEEEQIADIIEAHEDILNRLEENKTSSHYVVIQYTMKSGRVVKRCYSAPADGTNYTIISKYFYTPENILGYGDGDWEEFKENVVYLYWEYGEVPSSMYDAILEALKADCLEGKVRLNDYGTGTWLELQAQVGGQYVYRSMGIQAGAKHIEALVSSPEFILGYSDWEEFVEATQNLWVLGRESDFTAEVRRELLTAMKADCEAGALTLSDYDNALYWVEYDTSYQGQYLYRSVGITKHAENTVAWLKAHGYAE